MFTSSSSFAIETDDETLSKFVRCKTFFGLDAGDEFDGEALAHCSHSASLK
jgi:hypothetical protein